MRITSKNQLINYIKVQLGSPLITIEISDEQLSQIIDDTVQKFTEYAYGTLEGAVILELKGAKEYKLPDTITNILRLSKGSTSNITSFGTNFGNGYVPDIWSQQFFSDSFTGNIVPAIIQISTTKAILDKYFGDDIYYNFNPHKKLLQVFDEYRGKAFLHYQYEYIANESNDLIYNHEWVKKYCVARAKFLWGSIIGKYSQSLVGGATANFSDIKSEAQTDLEKFDEELLSRWSDPVPVMVG